MSPEELAAAIEDYHRRYGREPSAELLEAWMSGPQATDPFKGKPIREAIYNVAQPFMHSTVRGHVDPEDAAAVGGMRPGAETLLDPRILVSGIADVAGKSADPRTDPGKMDYLFGLLDVAGLGGAKAAGLAGREALRGWRANMPNLLEFMSSSRFLQPARSKGEAVENIMSYGPRQEQKVSFYSGAPGAPAAAMIEGAWRGTKDFMGQLFSLKDSWRWRSQGISKQKFDRIGEYFDETRRIFSNPDSWKVAEDGTSSLSTAAKDKIKKWNKIVTGDLNTMVKLAQREGIEMSDVVKQWDNIHWGEAKYIDSTKLADQLRQLPLSKNAVATKNSDLISTMINGNKGWKTEGDNFIMTQMLEKRSAGSATSPSDAQMTPAYVAIAKAYKAGARTADEFRKYFDSLEWRPKVGRIEEGADGSVLFQYSPKRKSDFYKGGFNSVAEVKPNGTTTFWLSDEFDLGKGAVKEVMEAGMPHRLLAVHKPKTIRTPEITEAGLDKARQEMAEIITKRGGVPVGTRTTPVSGAEEVSEVVAKKTGTDMLGMTKEELAAMRGLTADQSIPLGYRARFYGTRYGLPGVGAGLALPEKRKREELYE
jgi:hypothetical protein